MIAQNVLLSFSFLSYCFLNTIQPDININTVYAVQLSPLPTPWAKMSQSLAQNKKMPEN